MLEESFSLSKDTLNEIRENYFSVCLKRLHFWETGHLSIPQGTPFCQVPTRLRHGTLYGLSDVFWHSEKELLPRDPNSFCMILKSYFLLQISCRVSKSYRCPYFWKDCPSIWSFKDFFFFFFLNERLWSRVLVMISQIPVMNSLFLILTRFSFYICKVVGSMGPLYALLQDF